MNVNQFLPLQLEQVDLQYPSTRHTATRAFALQSLSFTLKQDGITLIMGDNGSGKTALLNIIAGLVSHSAGEIRWHKTPCPPQLSLVPQQTILFRGSVRDNIFWPLKKQGINARERTQVALEWANIASLADKQAQYLSQGEQQLVALARAWALKPSLLLLDEPTANLDPDRTQSINRLIQAMNPECKIIMSSHSYEQARLLADDILLLNAGQLQQHCSAKQFFQSMTLPPQ